MCREAVALLAAGRTTRSSSCCRLDAASISRVKCFLNCGIAGFAAHECDTNGRRNVPRFNNEYRLAIANSMVIFVVNVFWRCPNVWIDAVSERHLLESPFSNSAIASPSMPQRTGLFRVRSRLLRMRHGLAVAGHFPAALPHVCPSPLRRACRSVSSGRDNPLVFSQIMRDSQPNSGHAYHSITSTTIS